MSKPTALSAPLELTEKASTPAGMMRIVLSAYPAGALSVGLLPNADITDDTLPQMLSAEPPQGAGLARGEFLAACEDAALTPALFRKGLFRSTGRRLAGAAVWTLDGLAMIEFLSALRPSLAASRVSFPAHLFKDKDFDANARKHLIQAFEADGHTRHSARGAAVWVLKHYCEQQKIPFIVYLVKDGDTVHGVLVCKRFAAATLAQAESRGGHALQMVYESPLYS